MPAGGFAAGHLLVFVKRKSNAAAFFAQSEQWLGHRIYMGLLDATELTPLCGGRMVPAHLQPVTQRLPVTATA